MQTVATFEIKFHQFLNEEGKITQPLPAFVQDPKTIVRLYRAMVRLRLFDTKAVALQRTGKIGTFPSSYGQEAAMVGLGDATHADDVVACSYRDHGLMFQRGIRLAEVLAYWGGDERGNNYQHSRQDLPICVPIATQCLHGAGVATAFKYRNEKRAVMTVCGDGGSSKCDFLEALNVAGAWQLPIVFIINNNQWAISVPRRIQCGSPTLAQKAIGAGFEGIQVDGNDVIAVKWAATEALVKAREGGGPTLIEVVTYRMGDHTTADDAKRYRNEAELADAIKKEPLIRLQRYLSQIGVWDEQKDKALNQECAKEIELAVDEYSNLPPAPPSSMFDYLYEDFPETLLSQYDQVMGSR